MAIKGRDRNTVCPRCRQKREYCRGHSLLLRLFRWVTS
jgi:hypothetical protein